MVEQQRKERVPLTKNILSQIRKRKSSRPLNPKPDGLRRMLFLVLQKEGKDEDEEQVAYCVFCTGRFFEDHNGEQWIRRAKYLVF
jgi:hypothetical protein